MNAREIIAVIPRVMRHQQIELLLVARAGDGSGLVPVSYTHLDVYKRQPVHLQQRNTAQELSYPSVSVKSSQESCGKQVLTDKRKKGNIIQMLRNTSAQELGRMADEALERKRK